MNSGFINSEKPIPISGSLASRYLCIATMQALIAEELAAHVFVAVPSYTKWLKSTSPMPNWDKLAMDQPFQEAVLRSTSSIIYRQDEHELQEAQMASICDRICRKSRPLVFNIKAFEESLWSLLRESFNMWTAVQRSTRRIVGSTDGNSCMEYPAFEIDEAISISGEARATKLKGDIVTFPTISFVPSSDVIHRGYSLFASNQLYQSGVIEAERQTSRARRRG